MVVHWQFTFSMWSTRVYLTDKNESVNGKSSHQPRYHTTFTFTANLCTMLSVALARTTTRSTTSRLLLHRTFAAPAVQEVTTADKATKFLEKHDKSVFYFTAVWCPPCKAIKPVYEQLAEKYTDVAFAKVGTAITTIATRRVDM